jgi:hypothetical protein
VRYNNGIRAGPSIIAMTSPDFIEKMLKAKSIDAQTTGGDGKSWAAIFISKDMRLAARELLEFCGINADAL